MSDPLEIYARLSSGLDDLGKGIQQLIDTDSRSDGIEQCRHDIEHMLRDLVELEQCAPMSRDAETRARMLGASTACRLLDIHGEDAGAVMLAVAGGDESDTFSPSDETRFVTAEVCRTMRVAFESMGLRDEKARAQTLANWLRGETSDIAMAHAVVERVNMMRKNEFSR